MKRVHKFNLIKNLLFLSFFYFLIIPNLFSQTQKTVGVIKNQNGNDDKGYVLLTPLTSKNTYLIDKCGKELKTWKSKYLSGLIAYLLPDGSLLRAGQISDTNYMGQGKGGILEKYSWDGQLLWSYKISNDSLGLHHDFYPMKNGNILAIAWHGIPASIAESKGRKSGTVYSSKLWSERVLEIKPKGTNDIEIVWQWSLIDHIVQNENILMPDYDNISSHPELVDINYKNSTNSDWVHINAIDYNEELDQIVLSCHHFGEIWVIDHSTTTAEAATHKGGKRNKGGDILYRWGNPRTYQKGGNEDQVFFGQHNAYWIPKLYKDGGSIMVFNNGLGRNPMVSSVEIITPPQSSPGVYGSNLPYGPSTQTWVYKDSIPTKFYSAVISGAQRLPNGNTLICSGVQGRIFEVGNKNSIVWEYINPIAGENEITDGQAAAGNSVFRALFYPDTFSAFKNKTLKPGNPLEKNPISYSCNSGYIDFSQPVPQTFFPENRAINISKSVLPYIEFDENIKPGNTGNIYIFENNNLVSTLPYNSSNLNFSNKRLTINIPVELMPKSKVSIKIDENCITDLSNNGIETIDSSK
ncbi:MAG: aryl-sulfate sulfotransferase [Bacteroidia bacterium]|nr:aryl-sulfate sulfotransferase [Bacteroidia bacterium]